MNVIGDVLDQQLIDNKQRKAGKVDGITLEIRDNAPPRIAYLDSGAGVLARRLSKRLQRLVQRIRERVLGSSRPLQVPWSAVQRVDVSVNLNIDATEYSAYELERWLCDHLICRIPGNAHEKHQEKHD